MATAIVPGVISTDCITAGDAPEMESRLNAVLVAGGLSKYLCDAQITGVGVGPRWQVQLSAVDAVQPGLPAYGVLLGFVRRAGNPEALQAEIAAVLAAHTQQYVAICTDGGGAGRDYMAVILLFND